MKIFSLLFTAISLANFSTSYLIYDIQYSSEFEIKAKDFPEGYIPNSTIFLDCKSIMKMRMMS